MKVLNMTNNQDLTGPRDDDPVDRPAFRTDLDPIAIVTELVGDDPSVAELVAFRSSAPDLKVAAREAKRLTDEALRLRNTAEDPGAVRGIVAGLTLLGLGFKALVTIWPSDTLDEVDAKLALAEVTGPFGRQETDYVPTLDADAATRIRINRAAFCVGELMAPAAPAAPSSSDRSLACWPLTHYDLTTLLPQRGGPPVFADAQAQAWAGLLANAPDLGRLAARVEHMIHIADRLFALARMPGDNRTGLHRAAEGAQIIAYLAAAQIAIWPSAKGSDGAKAKKQVAKAIDDRACRCDPLNMQAAIRLMFEDGSWLGKLVDSDRMATGTPTWIPIV